MSRNTAKPSRFGFFGLNRFAERTRSGAGHGRRRLRPEVTALENRQLLSLTTLASFTGTNGSDPQGSLTVNQTLPIPSSVFVNSAWASDASGTPVTWTDNSTHYIGYDAFGTIQAGVSGVASGGTVNVAAGTYSETDTIAQNVTIDGAGASLVTVNGQNAGSVFTVDSGVTATLSGLTITGGKAAGGGGIDSYGKLTVTNCTIKGNSASGGGGGGILNFGGTLTVTGSTFSGCSATGPGTDVFGGGGLSNTNGGSATVTDCSFSGNSATTTATGFDAEGGAIYNNGVMTITGSTFSANTTDYVGGAIANGGGPQHAGYGLTIDGSTITGNSAGVDGGGIYNNSITLTISGTSIDGNVGQYGGGGIYNLAGTVTVTSGTISGNSCALALPNPQSYSTGGGIFSMVGGAVTVENTTISGNSAADGGGIANSYAFGLSGGTLSIIDSTVAGNSASLTGGGIAAFATSVVINDSTVTLNKVANAGSGGGVYVSGGTATLNNTIVALNTSGTGTSADDIDGSISPTSAYNLIGTGGSGGLTNGTNGNQVGVANPGLDPKGLQNNGGPTQTIALLPGSPAIDAGSIALAVDPQGNSLTSDQRGLPRVIGGTVDIGAFESQMPTKLAQTINFGSLPDKTYGDADFTISAIASSNLPVSFTASGNCAVYQDQSGNWDVHITGAGTGTIIAHQAGDSNYNAAPDVAQSFTIAKASLTINVSFDPARLVQSQTITYGDVIPSVYPQFVGLKYGDQISGLIQIAGDRSTSGHLTAGVHMANATVTSLSANYNLVASNPATLTVLQRPLDVVITVSDKQYDGTVNATIVSMTLDNLAGDDVVPDLGNTKVHFITPSAGSNKPLAPDSIGWGSLHSNDVNNYRSGNLSITPANITKADAKITVTPYSVSFDGTAHAATGTATGVRGEYLGGLDLSGTTHTSVGTYTDTWAFNDVTGNYNNTSGTASDSVLQAQPAFSQLTASQAITYGTPTISLSGKIAAPTVTPTGNVSITINGVATTAVIQPDGTFSTNYDTHALGASGTPYTITYAFAGDTNFTPASDGSTTLTVNKADQSIQWSNPADIGYGTALSATQLNATVTGVPGGSAPGALTYAPPAGTILNAGMQQALTVTAAETANYNAARATVYINVLTVQQQVGTLSKEVNALVPAHLSAGQAQVLKSGLTWLLTLTTNKSVNIVKVNSFIASVTLLLRTGILTQDQANPLIQEADMLLVTLQLG